MLLFNQLQTYLYLALVLFVIGLYGVLAYTLALLGERPRLMGTAGQDFDEYRQWLEAAGVEVQKAAPRRRTGTKG